MGKKYQQAVYRLGNPKGQKQNKIDKQKTQTQKSKKRYSGLTCYQAPLARLVRTGKVGDAECWWGHRNRVALLAGQLFWRMTGKDDQHFPLWGAEPWEVPGQAHWGRGQGRWLQRCARGVGERQFGAGHRGRLELGGAPAQGVCQVGRNNCSSKLLSQR